MRLQHLQAARIGVQQRHGRLHQLAVQGVGLVFLHQLGADLLQLHRAGQLGFQGGPAVAQRLVHLFALDQVGRLARQQVQVAQLVLAQALVLLPVGGEHTQLVARAADQRGGLGREQPGCNVQAPRPARVGIARVIEVDPGAPPADQGAAAGGVRAGIHPGKALDHRLAQPLGGQQQQRVAGPLQELHAAGVGMRQLDRRGQDLLVEHRQVVFRHQAGAQLLQQACGAQVCGHGRLGPGALQAVIDARRQLAQQVDLVLAPGVGGVFLQRDQRAPHPAADKGRQQLRPGAEGLVDSRPGGGARVAGRVGDGLHAPAADLVQVCLVEQAGHGQLARQAGQLGGVPVVGGGEAARRFVHVEERQARQAKVLVHLLAHRLHDLVLRRQARKIADHRVDEGGIGLAALALADIPRDHQGARPAFEQDRRGHRLHLHPGAVQAQQGQLARRGRLPLAVGLVHAGRHQLPVLGLNKIKHRPPDQLLHLPGAEQFQRGGVDEGELFVHLHIDRIRRHLEDLPEVLLALLALPLGLFALDGVADDALQQQRVGVFLGQE